MDPKVLIPIYEKTIDNPGGLTATEYDVIRRISGGVLPGTIEEMGYLYPYLEPSEKENFVNYLGVLIRQQINETIINRLRAYSRYSTFPSVFSDLEKNFLVTQMTSTSQTLDSVWSDPRTRGEWFRTLENQDKVWKGHQERVLVRLTNMINHADRWYKKPNLETISNADLLKSSMSEIHTLYNLERFTETNTQLFVALIPDLPKDPKLLHRILQSFTQQQIDYFSAILNFIQERLILLLYTNWKPNSFYPIQSGDLGIVADLTDQNVSDLKQEMTDFSHLTDDKQKQHVIDARIAISKTLMQKSLVSYPKTQKTIKQLIINYKKQTGTGWETGQRDIESEARRQEEAVRFKRQDQAYTDFFEKRFKRQDQSSTKPILPKIFPKSALNACLTALYHTIGIPSEYWKRWQRANFLLAKKLANIQQRYYPESDGVVDRRMFDQLIKTEGGLRLGCLTVANDPSKWAEPAIAAKCFRDGSVERGRDGNFYASTGSQWTKLKADASIHALLSGTETTFEEFKSAVSKR